MKNNNRNFILCGCVDVMCGIFLPILRVWGKGRTRSGETRSLLLFVVVDCCCAVVQSALLYILLDQVILLYQTLRVVLHLCPYPYPYFALYPYPYSYLIITLYSCPYLYITSPHLVSNHSLTHSLTRPSPFSPPPLLPKQPFHFATSSHLRLYTPTSHQLHHSTSPQTKHTRAHSSTSPNITPFLNQPPTQPTKKNVPNPNPHLHHHHHHTHTPPPHLHRHGTPPRPPQRPRPLPPPARSAAPRRQRGALCGRDGGLAVGV